MMKKIMISIMLLIATVFLFGCVGNVPTECPNNTVIVEHNNTVIVEHNNTIVVQNNTCITNFSNLTMNTTSLNVTKNVTK
jgi:hypothetical protein